MTAGRPPKYKNDEERWLAAKEYRRKSMENKASLAVSKDVLEAFRLVQDHLETELGFRITLQQAMRHVLVKAGFTLPKEGK